MNKKYPRSEHEKKGRRHNVTNDYICSVCHYGDELLLCDNCPSSFHTECLGLKEVPEGDWFCLSCCCKICSKNRPDEGNGQITDSSYLSCGQCEQRYILWPAGDYGENGPVYTICLTVTYSRLFSSDTFQAHRKLPVIPSSALPPNEPLETSDSSEGVTEVNGLDAYGTGLKNEVGEYNCFLNVIIQSLWHLRRFRDEFLRRSLEKHVVMKKGSKKKIAPKKKVMYGVFHFAFYESGIKV